MLLRNAVNLLLAPSALTIHTLKLGLKRRETRENFSFAPGAPKNGRLFKGVGGFTPSGKIFRAPMPAVESSFYAKHHVLFP